MTGRRVGILGGTFDPIHTGHIELGRAAQAALGLTQMLVITAHVPPHRPQPFMSSYHRFAMVSMAVAGLEGWRASDLELRTPAPSFTSVTLKRFHDRGYAPSELFFVIGADAFCDVIKWKDYPAILDRAHFAVVSRPGSPVNGLPQRLGDLADRMVQFPFEPRATGRPVIFLIDAGTSDVSSTAIRRRCVNGQSIAGLVPPAVQQHIEQHGLYTSMTPGRRALDAANVSTAGRLHGQE
jgi:nicotinate-nucleotide adenylyltransferase